MVGGGGRQRHMGVQETGVCLWFVVDAKACHRHVMQRCCLCHVLMAVVTACGRQVCGGEAGGGGRHSSHPHYKQKEIAGEVKRWNARVRDGEESPERAACHGHQKSVKLRRLMFITSLVAIDTRSSASLSTMSASRLHLSFQIYTIKNGRIWLSNGSNGVSNVREIM